MCASDASDNNEPDEPAELTADDLVAEIVDLETQKRLWVRTLLPLLQLRSHQEDPSGRVQLAFDLMHIAACDRIRQLLRCVQASDSDSA